MNTKRIGNSDQSNIFFKKNVIYFLKKNQRFFSQLTVKK